MNWVKVQADIPENDFILQLNIEGKKLCLVKHQGQFYATQNTCPHAGGILSGGWCKEGNIVCPIHRWEYSLTTGRGAEGQGDYIETYATELREDGLYIGLKQSWIKKFFS